MKLMIVAHPDDESLFGGGQLISDPGWMVICITNGNNPIRRKEFESAMKIAGAEFEIWDYPDHQHTPFNDALRKELQRIVKLGWDKIVTHNEYGEYGHPHHRQLHGFMKKIATLSVFDFGERLPNEIWAGKLNLIQQYKSQQKVCSRLIKMARNESLRLLG